MAGSAGRLVDPSGDRPGLATGIAIMGFGGGALIGAGNVSARNAIRTSRFWLLWVVVLTVLAWSWVVVPFLYGRYQLLIKVPALFGG